MKTMKPWRVVKQLVSEKVSHNSYHSTRGEARTRKKILMAQGFRARELKRDSQIPVSL